MSNARKTSCARCGRRLSTGGHTQPPVACRDCWDVDPDVCQTLTTPIRTTTRRTAA